jgi:hypothetical protein
LLTQPDILSPSVDQHSREKVHHLPNCYPRWALPTVLPVAGHCDHLESQQQQVWRGFQALSVRYPPSPTFTAMVNSQAIIQVF